MINLTYRYLFVTLLLATQITSTALAGIQPLDERVWSQYHSSVVNIEKSGMNRDYVKLSASNPWSSNKSVTAEPVERVDSKEYRSWEPMNFPDKNYNPYARRPQFQQNGPHNRVEEHRRQQPYTSWSSPEYSRAFPYPDHQYGQGQYGQRYSPYSDYSGGPGYSNNDYDYRYTPRDRHRGGGYRPGYGGFSTPWSGEMPGFSMPFSW